MKFRNLWAVIFGEIWLRVARNLSVVEKVGFIVKRGVRIVSISKGIVLKFLDSNLLGF